MKNTLIIGGAVVATLLAESSCLSPHWTLYQMRMAMEKRDAGAFSKHVDFPAMRESFRGQMMAALNRRTAGDKAGGNPFAAMGQPLAAAPVSPMIDAMVTPAGVIAMMNIGTPKPTEAVITAATKSPPREPATMPPMRVAYEGWSTVTVQSMDSREGGGCFVLKRQGFWSWKLSSVELPAAETKAN
jgi:hypothetical protein